MKRYGSVFQLVIRSSVYKVLSVLTIMIIAEAILLAYGWNLPIATFHPTLEEWVERSWIWIPFLLAYWLVSKIVALSGTNVGSMQSYTLQRLRITEAKVFLLRAIYNILVYVLLWMVQILMLFATSGFYMRYKAGVLLTNQTIFLAFHRNWFMHAILPMHDIFGWYILGFAIVGTGILTADFSRSKKDGKTAWSLILFIVLIMFSFKRSLGSEPIFMLIFTLMWGTYETSQLLLGKEVQKNEGEK